MESHGPRRPHSRPAGKTSLFATAMPGLTSILTDALASLAGVTVADAGFDGRSDVVVFDVARGQRTPVFDLGLTDDLFVEVGRTTRTEGDRPQAIAERIWRTESVQRALSIWANEVRPLSGTMTFRVIVRVLHERSFLRTDLRRQLTGVVQRDRPKWRFADPAQIEVWITEYRPGAFIAGLRLSSAGMRQHGGRAVQRPGALRPTVAAAMVRLAGTPNGVLFDPCCGSGTILGEALSAGWRVVGADIDSAAVAMTRENAQGAASYIGDVRSVAMADETVGACVSNLPFGRQYSVQGDTTRWLRRALREMARVTEPGGRIVLLTPDLPANAVPGGLTVLDRHQLRLLGLRTSIWALRRTQSGR